MAICFVAMLFHPVSQHGAKRQRNSQLSLPVDTSWQTGTSGALISYHKSTTLYIKNSAMKMFIYALDKFGYRPIFLPFMCILTTNEPFDDEHPGKGENRWIPVLR
jgi:hypothetical protein